MNGAQRIFWSLSSIALWSLAGLALFARDATAAAAYQFGKAHDWLDRHGEIARRLGQ
jgi:phosphatidylglycerophosphate synthase